MTIDVLIGLSGEADLSGILGLILRSRIGTVVSATVTPAALEAVAENPAVRYIEPAVRLKRFNDVATAASSAVGGQLDSGSPVALPYDAQAGQSLTISMHAGAGQESTFDPVLKVCQDSECNTILATDDDSGPGSDAQLTFTFQTTGTFFIEVSEKMGRAGDFRLILYNDPTKRVPLGIGAKPLHDSGLEGQGVIIGVLDFGIDWCHEDFVDDITGKSRIQFLWDQNLVPEREGESKANVGNDSNASNDYGVEYTAAQINAALNAGDCTLAEPTNRQVRTADTRGHGTHVTGIAASDGSATNGQEPAGKYKGVAPKADLIIVKLKEVEDSGFTETTSLIDANAYVLAKAKMLNQPVVVNISLGTLAGSMDGTSLLDQAIQNAIGPGQVIVASSGNAQVIPIHAEGTISANGADTVNIDLSNCHIPDCTDAVINLWQDEGDAYTITVTAPNGTPLSAAHGETRSAIIDGSIVQIFNAVSSPSNGDKNSLITFSGRGSGLFIWSLKLQRTANGGSGKWDAWVLPAHGEIIFRDHVPKNPDTSVAGTVAEPASSTGAIAVGAHTTKFRWESSAGSQQSTAAYNDFGRIYILSSGGPTRDGRIKPDVTAPGFVISAASADCPVSVCLPQALARDGHHRIQDGTSMSAPMVTGAAALILQADPTNFPRPLLQSTAVRDTFTGTDLPNNIWGHGKVNVLRAFTALQSDQPPTVSLSTGAIDETTVPFTTTASDPDPDDGIAEYLWDFDNDGATDAITTAPSVSWKYPSGGTYTARVIAVDQKGKTAIATTSVSVSSSNSDDGRGCFIATAAYGSYLDPHVQTLRNFRDEVLMPSALGKTFVDFYYVWSPDAARFIAPPPPQRGTPPRPDAVGFHPGISTAFGRSFTDRRDHTYLPCF
ncbi:MAG: S8 family serine peptidase [Candidatus Manganitrophus sp.]|nr:S8 family serine peptidase [Candidatus Manganitrophus sp.]